MKRDSFVFYKSWLNVISGLPADVQLEIYQATMEYAINGNLTELKPMAKVAFAFIKQDIDRAFEKYDDIQNSRSEAGQMGNLKRWNKDLYDEVVSGGLTLDEAVEVANHRKSSQTVANHRKNRLNVNDNDNDNESVSVAPAHARGDETDAPVSKNTLIPLSTCKDEMLKDQMWQERVCMNTHISKEQLLSLINKFIKHLENQNETKKTLFDCYKHFGSWIASQKMQVQPKSTVVTGNFFKN